MGTNRFEFKDFHVLEFTLVNRNPYLSRGVNVEITRKFRKKGSDFLCKISASIFDEKEQDIPDNEKDFYIKYVVDATVSCDNAEAQIDDVGNTIMEELYPHIRAGISSVMGIAGLEPLMLPFHLPQ